MNPYETMIDLMRMQGSQFNPPTLKIGEMKNATTCELGTQEIDKDFLLVAEHLTTGYHKAVNNTSPATKNDSTFVKPLKAGDMVLLYKLDDESYIILERLVEL